MIWFYEGEIYRYRCHYEKAIRCYRKVEKLAEKDQDKLRMSLGVEGQARVYLDTVQPIKADPLLRKSVSLLKSSTTNSQEREMSLYLLVAENLLNMGNALDAEDWYLQSQSMGISSKYELKMVELKARLYLRTGRLKQAKEVVKKYREKHEYHASLSSAHRTVDILLSVISAYMGEAEEAKKFAQSGILQGAKWKAPFVEACGWMRIGHAVQLNPSYEKEMSVKCYETAMSIMDEIHISRGKAEAWMGLCLLYGKKGFYDLALECGKKALTETEKAKDAWLSSYIRLSLGIAAYYHDDNEEAEHYFQQCYRLFQSCHCQYGLMLACFWLSLIAFQEKKEKSFGFFFQQWLQHVHEQNYHFFIERKILFGPNDSRKMIPMLIKAKNEGIEIHLANQLLEWLGMKDISFHPGYTLKVQTLGDFKVFLGEKEVKGGEWKREKAKELFQLLITFRDRLLLRNTILSLLWGENDELTAERDFKVALNALNKVIEPNRKARSDPYFIERRGLSYGLNSNANIEIDKVEFQKLTEKGLNVKDRNQAIDILNKALTLYKGDYLPDRAYDDWCLEERERLQLLFLRGAERLAQLNVEKEQFDETIHWCSQILAIDSCWEEAYRLLMYCYYRKNNRAYAVKLYEKCRNQLQKELGVEPLESTKQMLKMIKEVNFIT
nr:BTAD domain-containing putative transcriptional regulator [Bacillus sp. FJAT-47783]